MQCAVYRHRANRYGDKQVVAMIGYFIIPQYVYKYDAVGTNIKV
jgi:hypothetical protein